jgi:IS6 family transposase
VVWRWVQRYAPELDRRVRRELRPTAVPGVDETCVRVAGRRIYLYGAVDSTGATNDFHLSTVETQLPLSNSFAKTWPPGKLVCG